MLPWPSNRSPTTGAGLPCDPICFPPEGPPALQFVPTHQYTAATPNRIHVLASKQQTAEYTQNAGVAVRQVRNRLTKVVQL